MRFIFLISFTFYFVSLHAQKNENYRFSFGVSGFSIMNYGLRDFKNIDSPQNGHYNKVYQTEKYTLDYENFTFSKGLNYYFSVNIVTNQKYVLKFRANVFTEKFNEKLTYTLTDIGDGTLLDYGSYIPKFTTEDIPLGYSGTVTYKSKDLSSLGYTLDLVLLKKISKNFKIGGGMFYYFHIRKDRVYDYNEYVPIGINIGRGSNSYSTKKIGLAFEVQKTYNRFSAFINLSQTVFTTKKANKKGGTDFFKDEAIVPISQNLDFRFPLIIKVGVEVEFGKVKQKEEYIVTGTPSF